MSNKKEIGSDIYSRHAQTLDINPEFELLNNNIEESWLTTTSKEACIVDESEGDEDDTNDTRCGWWIFKPKFLQIFNNIRSYLIVLSLLGLVQLLASFGLVGVSITTLERRFGFSSIQSGSIPSAYQISAAIFTIIVAYFGEKGHKPLWVGTGSLCLSVGTLIFALPHFLTGDYQYRHHSDKQEVCVAANLSLNILDHMCGTSNNATQEEEYLFNYYWFFITGQILCGIAGASLFTLGITYLDEHLTVRDFSMYFGIHNAFLSLGPAAGYVIGGLTLSLYTDMARDPESITITPDNPVWVGAWWLGFLIASVIVTCLGILLMGFPKSLPGSKRIAKQRISQAQTGSGFQSRTGLRGGLLDFPHALLNVITNIPFMCLSMGNVTEWFIISGFATFAPKYLESQYNMTASRVATIIGTMSVTSEFTGGLISGFIMKQLNLKFAGMMKMCVICSAITFAMAFAFMLDCPNVPFAGVTVSYGNRSRLDSPGEGALLADCNSHCVCYDSFESVCGEDDVMYYSPCHAGCTVEDVSDGGEIRYRDCHCISHYNNTFDEHDTVPSSVHPYNSSVYATTSRLNMNHDIHRGEADPGRCSTSCPYKWPVLVMIWIFLFVNSVAIVPGWGGSMRCVSHSQRAFALGVQAVLFGGTAPGPIVFGFVIDKACILWETGCDGTKKCWMYDNYQFARSLLYLTLSFKCLSMLFFTGSFYFYKPVVDIKSKDEMEEGDTILKKSTV